eukprot:GHVN01042807.1.p1 GENE.GHVN01042807.1~~GHVN01042807.1.p1  ORF type:complete len:173 (-),score=26.20 GHVN01042807.1:1206-1724(-)
MNFLVWWANAVYVRKVEVEWWCFQLCHSAPFAASLVVRKGTQSRPLQTTDVVKDKDGQLVSVLPILAAKHPPAKPPTHEACQTKERVPTTITSAHLSKARKLQGSGGPSGTDAAQWRALIFRQQRGSSKLRDAVVSLADRLANRPCPFESIKALTACRLVALESDQSGWERH